MNNLKKKQKIILLTLTVLVTIIISYYMYIKNEEVILEEQETENISEEKNEEPKEESNIIVHISGAVQQEGIVELKENSRIADAIEKAGGLKEDANTKEVNLAYKLEDGMKIYIPSINDVNNTESNRNRNYNEWRAIYNWRK